MAPGQIRWKSPRFFAGIVGILLAGIAWEGNSHGGIIGKDPPSNVRSERSVEAILSGIGGRIEDCGGRLLSIGSRTFLSELYLPLARSGRLKELFLLIPGGEAMKPDEVTGIRERLAEAGVSRTNQETFRLEDGSVRGVMNGVSVRIFPVTRVPAGVGKGAVVFIDPEFLLSLYRNEVGTPVVELARKLVVTLRDRGVRSEDVFLASLPPSDDASLRYAFLEILLREMIASPATFEESLPEKWEILQKAETASFFAQSAEAALLYRRYLEIEPRDASACYKIAMAAVRDLDDDLALHWLHRAAAIDARFVRGFMSASDYLAKRRLFDPAERILRAGTAAFPRNGPLSTAFAAFLLMRGESTLARGNAAGAQEYFGMAAAVEGADRAVVDAAKRRLDPEPSSSGAQEGEEPQ